MGQGSSGVIRNLFLYSSALLPPMGLVLCAGRAWLQSLSVENLQKEEEFSC